MTAPKCYDNSLPPVAPQGEGDGPKRAARRGFYFIFYEVRMQNTLVLLCIVFPVLAAVVMLGAPGQTARRAIIFVTAAVVGVSSLLLAGHGPFTLAPKTFLGIDVNGVMSALDYALLLFILYLSFKIRNSLVTLFTVAQIAGVAYLHFFMPHNVNVFPEIQADSLSLVMVLLISLVGSFICIYAIGYMQVHEEHLKLERTKEPRFFSIMLLFIGVMNGLVLSNSLQWLYFFWEVTSLCSFALIAHDGTPTAIKNASRALWMNMLGGVGFVLALLLLANSGHELSLSAVLNDGTMGGNAAKVMLLPMALMCFAGFTKSAQIPFQSWLCGAMVAPTPVSALLHSSTMVKAGVYLVLRLAPAYAGTSLSPMVALFGAFTFLATSALAVGQSNGKKILAYSTIANLGLIVTCAGINTPGAVSAAIMLIVFHAVSKALLFLCMGTVEQTIGSRDIEDMRGLYSVMPRTTIIMVIGILSMILPPFGMLLGKWMALESAASTGWPMAPLVVMLALGSGLTVLFWARWAGILLGNVRPGSYPPPEDQHGTIRGPLLALSGAAVALSFLSPVVYAVFVEPMVALPYTLSKGAFADKMGVFAVYPIFIVLALGARWAWKCAARSQVEDKAAVPYMSGAQTLMPDGAVGFMGPMNKPEKPVAANYYIRCVFGESKLTALCNTASLVLLVVMLAMTTGGMQ